MFVIKKIIPFFCAFAILFSFPATGWAADTETDYKQQSSFWTWIAGTNSFLSDLIGYTTGAVCPDSEDGYHHATSYQQNNEDGYYTCICSYCGERFVGYQSDAQQSYDSQVSDLPATSVTSSGRLIYWADIHFFYSNGFVAIPGGFMLEPIIWPSNNNPAYLIGVDYFAAPIDGYYEFFFEDSLSNLSFYPDETQPNYKGSTSGYGTFSPGISTFYFAGSRIGSISNYYDGCIYFEYLSETDRISGYLQMGWFCEPYEASVLDAFSASSRPTSITGDYGIIGDNGEITHVESTTIVNETNNTFTNPSTGTTSTITEWTYDYSDRSYNLTLDTGDTVTVTYGDENVTIQEGDTVYNIYYIVDGTGQGTDPDACQHEYTSTVDREATCTVPGQTTYTCSLCGHTYTEAIPAKGHTWTVLQTVTTEYDQEGNLLQQGYTIYQCSVCGEQYKDENGTGPPDSGGGAGSDGESIWDKLGDLLGTVFGGIIDLIEAVLGAILDALTSLATMIAEKLTAVVDLVLRMFTEIPKLFTGFLGFLAAVFPYIPEEAMMMLTFGITVVVFIGIIKALRR